MSSRNKTIKLQDKDLSFFENKILRYSQKSQFQSIKNITNKTICGNTIELIKWIPNSSVNLIVVDPPYNLTKKYNKKSFSSKNESDYENWLENWISECKRILKPNGSMYVCTDWKSSISIFKILKKYFQVNNRITWAREKGRGSDKNWKNNIEDIYFVSKSKEYFFDSHAVKIKKRVIAPYRDDKGQSRDWFEEKSVKYRLTHHSNIWTDLTVPYWSMPENTDHPTQKPEKLIAKLILASSKKGDLIFDPFLGSGTTSVVAKKLDRKYIGIELDEVFASIAEKRLHMVDKNKNIQGYNGKHFLAKGVK